MMMCLLVTPNAGVYAAENDALTADETVVGGWDEKMGYFTNEEFSGILPVSQPYHTGRSERRDWNGYTYTRALGWTRWEGVYHYTRAMVVSEFGQAVADSGRQYGVTSTSAVSPWAKASADYATQARSYYGKD